MGVIDYLVLGGLGVAVLGAVLFILKRKKQGKGSCGQDCGNCPYKTGEKCVNKSNYY